jgi:hypothetical protein
VPERENTRCEGKVFCCEGCLNRCEGGLNSCEGKLNSCEVGLNGGVLRWWVSNLGWESGWTWCTGGRKGILAPGRSLAQGLGASRNWGSKNSGILWELAAGRSMRGKRGNTYSSDHFFAEG